MSSTEVSFSQDFGHLSQGANYETNLLSLTETCSSGDSRCPITNIELSQGRSYFDFVDSISSVSSFSPSDDEFTVSLNDRFLS